MYQQDRWNRFGGNGAVTAVSDDNGLGWKPSNNFPAFFQCTGGHHGRPGPADARHAATTNPVDLHSAIFR